MKPTFIKVNITLVFLVFLTSCGADRFTGKHYRNRSWVKVEPIAQQKPQIKKSEPSVTINADVSTVVEDEISISTVQTREIVSTDGTKQIKQESVSTPINNETQTQEIVLDYNKINSTEVISDKTAVFKKNIMHDSDVMLIVEIILAFLLPFLAVYIHDGGSSGLFILTLILCLLTIVGGIWIFGGLFGLWGISTILAILRIFDII